MKEGHETGAARNSCAAIHRCVQSRSGSRGRPAWGGLRAVHQVVDQGGEPHTFTEVKKFGGGFITDLNAGEETVPECAGGFKNIDVARTRILQGSQLQVNGLSKGEHKFECCIHPWMRMTVDVK